MIDWQLVLRAAGVFDIAYFMSQSVPIDVRRQLERDVVTHYRDRLIELGVEAPTFDELWDGYRLAVVLCLVYPVVSGGTADPDDERSMNLARAMLDRCATASEDLNGLSFLT